MRFTELLVVAAAVFVVVNAAPVADAADKRAIAKDDKPWKKEGFVWDPSKWSKDSGRRGRDSWKGKGHKKRSPEPCCGGEGNIGLDFGARLDIGASGTAQVGVPAHQQQAGATQQQAAAAAPINRNDRNGDSVVVVVDAKHSG